MAKEKSINLASTPASATVLIDAVNSVSWYLGAIGDLAEMVTEQADEDNGTTRIEALALSIRTMAESVATELQKHVDAAREVSHV